MNGQKEVYLSNGDLLILLDGQYFISYGGDTQPKGIEKEEGARLLFETASQLRALVKKHTTKKETNIKFLKEIDVVLQDEEVDKDERNTSFSICECMNCHWKFIGECERHGYGFTSQGVQIPDYCPMCAFKIVDIIE